MIDRDDTVEPRAHDIERPHTLQHRIYCGYHGMPGLSLTAPQAARLFGLSSETCDEALGGLVDAGLLRRTIDGRYVENTVGPLGSSENRGG